MASWLRTLAAFAEDPGLVPRTHMAAHNRRSDVPFWLPWAPGMYIVYTHAYRQRHSYT